MTKETLEQMCEAASESYLAELQRIAAMVRQEVVIPYCIRYHLRFRQGNGSFFFYHCSDGTRKEPSERVRNILEAEADPRGQWGIHEFMDNYG